MKVGIDSYSYHRFFGEVYPQQSPPPRRMALDQFLQRAKEIGAEGVSLESCFLPSVEAEHLRSLRHLLDQYELERVYAWGHPRGLEAGKNEKAFQEMLASFAYADLLGAKVMRVVSSSRLYRGEPHGPQLERLKEWYRQAVPVAERYGIRFAVENHMDYTTDELLELLEAVSSPYMGITFDFGNFVRLGEDPVEAMRKLGPFVYATHVKDLQVNPGVPSGEWYAYASVPIGEGFLDIPTLLQMLKDAGYTGLLAVEMDFLHPAYPGDEDAAVAESIQRLKRMVEALA
ncbi:MAG: sugar phosphate isomerase/epimerase family protein [Anaerolineae bacterium]